MKNKIQQQKELPLICQQRELCKTCYNWLSQEDVGPNDLPHCSENRANEINFLKGYCDNCDSYLNQ